MPGAGPHHLGLVKGGESPAGQGGRRQHRPERGPHGGDRGLERGEASRLCGALLGPEEGLARGGWLEDDRSQIPALLCACGPVNHHSWRLPHPEEGGDAVT